VLAVAAIALALAFHWHCIGTALVLHCRLLVIVFYFFPLILTLVLSLVSFFLHRLIVTFCSWLLASLSPTVPVVAVAVATVATAAVIVPISANQKCSKNSFAYSFCPFIWSYTFPTPSMGSVGGHCVGIGIGPTKQVACYCYFIFPSSSPSFVCSLFPHIVWMLIVTFCGWLLVSFPPACQQLQQPAVAAVAGAGCCSACHASKCAWTSFKNSLTYFFCPFIQNYTFPMLLMGGHISHTGWLFLFAVDCWHLPSHIASSCSSWQCTSKCASKLL